MVYLIVLIFLALLLFLAWWKSQLLTDEDIDKANSPKARPKPWLFGHAVIAKNKRKAKLEMLAITITVIGAALGLTLSFWVNDIKTKTENKARIIKVIDYQLQKLRQYSAFLRTFGIPEGDSANIAKFKNAEDVVPYPYFSKLSDPVVYDFQPGTRDLLSGIDMNVRGGIFVINDGYEKNFAHFHEDLTFFDSSCISMLKVERDFQNGDISDSDYAQQYADVNNAAQDYIRSRRKLYKIR